MPSLPKGVHLHRMNGTKNELLCSRPRMHACHGAALARPTNDITRIQSREKFLQKGGGGQKSSSLRGIILAARCAICDARHATVIHATAAGLRAWGVNKR